MKYLQIAFAALLVAVQAAAHASIITVEFDVNITSKQANSSYEQVTFEPLLHQYASITFDDTLTATDRNTSTENIINQHVTNVFGADTQTVIVSPLEYLTNVNPLSSAQVTTTSMTRSILWYNLAPPDYSDVSFAHQVVAGSSSRSDVYKNPPFSYEGESWQRTVAIYGLEYLGAFDQAALESYDFNSEDLLAYFKNMWDTAGVFSFYDGYSYSNRPSLLTSGYRWEGTATITNIIGLPTSAVPEPSVYALFGVGLIAFATVRRRSSKTVCA